MKALCKKFFLGLITLLFAQQLFAQAPTIISFSPTTAGEGDTVTITGTGFTTGFENPTYAYFGGNAVSSITVSSTTIKAFIATGYSGDVTVQNDSGTAALPGFTYNSNPIIISVVPDTASFGQTVTITGKYLLFGAIQQPPTVSFGGVAATSVTEVTPFSTVKAVVGNGASGTISLNTPFGTTTYPRFVYDTIPVISSFTPTSAMTGQTVTIKGKFLTGATSVSFGTVPAKSFIVVSDTVVQAVVGNGASGNIVLKTGLGTTTISGFNFSSPCTVTTSITSQTICSSQLPYYWGRQIIYSQGTYVDTLINLAGCDSIVTLNLSVNPQAAKPTGANAFRCGAGTLNLSATLSGATDILKWYSDTTLQQQEVATGTNFTTPVLNVTTNYYVTETNTVGCTSKPLVITATINTTQIPPNVDSIVYYPQNQKISGLTATPDAGDTLLWYNTATGGTGSKVAPVPSTAIIGSTVYYVSQTNACGESPRSKITVIIEASIPVQLCAPFGNTELVSNLKGGNYQWQLNTGFGFNNITNNDSNYIGVNDSLLQLINTPSSWNGYQYRCVVNGANGTMYTLEFADTWKGTTDSTWSNVANWSCGKLPDYNTDVFINSGTVVLKSNAIVRSLTVSPGANFTVAAGFNLTVTH
jgi:hypothetical protein